MSEGIRKRAKARILDRYGAEQSELAALREQVKVLRESKKQMLDEIIAEVEAIDILGKVQTSRLTSFLLKMEAKL